MSLEDFSSTDGSSESSESGEFETVSIVRPYGGQTFGTLERSLARVSSGREANGFFWPRENRVKH